MAAAKSSSNEQSIFERLAPIMLVVIIGLAFAVGVLWQKVSGLEGGSTKTTVKNTADTVNANDTAPAGPVNGKLTEAQAAKLPAVSSEDYVRGNRDAEVFLIEYSDLQCPYCDQFHDTAKQAVDDYGGKVAWVYRHFPLDAIHPKARPAAITAECVAKLGGNDAFWKFTDAVFADQNTTLADLPGTVAKIGVNSAQVASCVDANETEDLVNADYDGGLAAGVTGTPGNYIVNSKGEVWSMPGAMPISSLKATIDEALGS